MPPGVPPIIPVSCGDYVSCVLGWFTVLLAIIGYFYTLRKTGNRWAFWIIFATGWAMLAIAHSMRISGVAPGATSLIVIRIVGYSLMPMALLSLILRLRRAIIKS
jgi:hypothetical protein